MRILHFSLIVLLAVIYCAAATSTDTKSWSKTESKGHSKTASSWVHSGTSKAPHKDLDHHHHNSTKEHGLSKECERLKKLEETVQIFSNATKLEGFEKKHNLTSEEVAKLQDKAQNITAELEKLKSNTTLITECIKLEEHLKLLHKCDEIKKLTFIVGIASNTTEDSELEKHFRINLTSSDEAKLSKFVANATAQLAKLEANATLVAECEKLVNITISTGTASSSIAKQNSSVTNLNKTSSAAAALETTSDAVSKLASTGLTYLIGVFVAALALVAMSSDNAKAQIKGMPNAEPLRNRPESFSYTIVNSNDAC